MDPGIIRVQSDGPDVSMSWADQIEASWLNAQR
jgi:hypothetical protein